MLITECAQRKWDVINVLLQYLGMSYFLMYYVILRQYNGGWTFILDLRHVKFGFKVGV